MCFRISIGEYWLSVQILEKLILHKTKLYDIQIVDFQV